MTWLTPQDGSPWGGMSGAVVIKDGMVVGVIRSPRSPKGPQALAVTPLTALKGLPEGRRQRASSPSLIFPAHT